MVEVPFGDFVDGGGWLHGVAGGEISSDGSGRLQPRQSVKTGRRLIKHAHY
jgi:hypothetical protein